MYKFLPHTADIKFKIISKDFFNLVKESLKAINFYLKPKIIKNQKPKKVILKRELTENINSLIDFLNEILALTYTQKMVFSLIKIDKKEIHLLGYAFEKLKKEIKAFTYHQAQLGKEENKITFEFIADI